MIRNISLLIKKDLFGRHAWMTMTMVILILLCLPVVMKQYWNYNQCFLPICYVGLFCAFTTAYGETMNVFFVRYNKAGILGTLPVTRLEIIISRHVATFVGILFASLFMGALLVLSHSFPDGIMKFYNVSATMIVLSLLIVTGASDLLLLLASFIQNTKGMYLLTCGFYFFYTVIGEIITWLLGQIHLSFFQLLLAVLAAITITVVSMFLNYLWFKRQAIG